MCFDLVSAQLSATTMCLCGGSVRQHGVFQVMYDQSSCIVQYCHHVFLPWSSAILSCCSLDPLQSLFYHMLDTQGQSMGKLIKCDRQLHVADTTYPAHT